MRIIAIINDNKEHTEVLLKSLAGNTGEYIRVYSLEDVFDIETRFITMDDVIPLKMKKRYGRIVPKSFSAMPLLKKLMDENFDEILMLRGNLIVRKSLDGIWDKIKYNTLKVRKSAGKSRLKRFYIDVILTGNSPYTYKFVTNVIAKIKEEPFYRMEPYIFFEEIKKVDELNFTSLDMIYNCITFYEKSVIWNFKGEHFSSVIFEKEYKRLFTGEGKRVLGL